MGENAKRFNFKFFVMECAHSNDRATLTDTGTDDHELFCF